MLIFLQKIIKIIKKAVKNKSGRKLFKRRVILNAIVQQHHLQDDRAGLRAEPETRPSFGDLHISLAPDVHAPFVAFSFYNYIT